MANLTIQNIQDEISIPNLILTSIVIDPISIVQPSSNLRFRFQRRGSLGQFVVVVLKNREIFPPLLFRRKAIKSRSKFRGPA